MSDIIQLLPDSVANQIAAGEVIQRPASLLKELMENAIDAGASEISVIVKDSGRALVQVVDNGCGMSETDARMAFERHATSKIRNANDLFHIRTMGFRGEALASIAAVAQVELITRTRDSELGTKIVIAGSKVEMQEPVACNAGSSFAIKNLFFNVPARRRFLKSNATELKQLITEFQRVVLTNPQIYFKLYHNDLSLFNLPPSNLKQRIINVIGKQIQTQLIPIEVGATIVNIYGFAGTPQSAKKTTGDQFFFVNNRFMRHPHLHKAVLNAYNKLILPDCYPSYFIYFEVNPETIDINIHPTKTEIKFEDEIAIWQILNAAIRESLGKFNVIPSIDFDTEGIIDIPVLGSETEINQPNVRFNPDFNPFKDKNNSYYSKPAPKNWEALYESFSGGAVSNRQSDGEEFFLSSLSRNDSNNEQLPLNVEAAVQDSYFQIKNRYILTSVKSGIMLIDIRRAHERILFERFLSFIQTKKSATQQILFPSTVLLSPENATVLKSIDNEMKILGF